MVDERDANWIKAATGSPVEGSWFTLERVLMHRRDLSDPAPFRHWWVALDLVEDKGDAETVRHQLASASGVQFAFPLDDDWSELREEADAADADIHSVVETLVAGDLDDGLAELVTMEALYIASVEVAEPVRGHRWGCAAVANLLDAMDRSETVVLAHEPVGRPEHPVVARIAAEFGALPVPGGTMRWHHTSLADFEAAVQKWVSGPYQFD
jgi:hypothetical protein